MKVFVVNCGSSSIKFQLFAMGDESVLAKGIMERVGTDQAILKMEANGADLDDRVIGLEGAPDHKAGFKTILAALVEAGAIASFDELEGVGHRVVHGGETIHASRIIDDEVLNVIRANCELAPLHNPPNLAGIEGAMAVAPNVPHVAVFDTAFLSTLPEKAYRYALPTAWYREHHIRRYGFHGTSHRHVTLRAAELLGKPVDEVNLITAHLGNGCSITAIAGGKAVDHSMGMTPLEGLVMGTRSGDIDPAVVFYLLRRGMTVEQIDDGLNKQSGLLGLSERSNDMRDLLVAIDAGDDKAALAVEVFVHRIAKYVGAYYTILPSVDAVVLTGGVGENSAGARTRICQGLARLGVVFDAERNERTVFGETGPISADACDLPVWVVPTNEELMIARDTEQIARSRG